MSDFHRVTQNGSKIRHATVTGVTGVTQPVVSCDSAPPLGRALRGHEKEGKNMYIHVKVRLENIWKSWKKVSEKSRKS